jgi:hypothetical protein
MSRSVSIREGKAFVMMGEGYPVGNENQTGAMLPKGNISINTV